MYGLHVVLRAAAETVRAANGVLLHSSHWDRAMVKPASRCVMIDRVYVMVRPRVSDSVVAGGEPEVGRKRLCRLIEAHHVRMRPKSLGSPTSLPHELSLDRGSGKNTPLIFQLLT